jgi:hypothetical protein
MKAKKAFKRLNKAEELLSDVIDGFSVTKDGLGELLDTAKAAVVRAKKALDSQLSTRTARKPPVKAQTAQRGRLTPEGRKRISEAAKRRWALTRRKSMAAAGGRRLSKTA